MPASSPVAEARGKAWRRRALSIPVVVIGLSLMLATLPLWVVTGFAIDRSSDGRRSVLPSLAFLTGYLAHELVGVVWFACNAVF